MTDMKDKDIRICDNKGFHLDLPNGVTVSVQLGPGNYCDSDCSNAAFDAPKPALARDAHWGSATAEDLPEGEWVYEDEEEEEEEEEYEEEEDDDGEEWKH